MVFGRIGEIVLAATKSSSGPYEGAGLPPRHGVRLGSSGKKKTLRLSSSLQDFSAYRQIDPEEGDIDHEEKTISVSTERRKWKHLILILLCLLLIVFLVYAYLNWSQEGSRFYIVLDCGSTGTRVNLFKASVNSKKDGNLPILLTSLPEGFQSSQSGRAYNRMESEPGFDKLVHNITGLKQAIKPLIRWAKKQIPVKSHKTTSLFLYATAGLRRIPSSDSEWLLSNAWSILKDSPFLCKREWVKIISGTEEAYYGWIALNYQTGTLGAIPNKETLGALDLGGSSLQVTFESKADSTQDETSLQLRVGDVNHHLNAYSLSGYGLNDAFDKSVVRLLKGLPQITNSDLLSGKIEINHPCLNSGYKEQYICSHCASEKGKPGVTLQLIGAPKWEECKALAKVAVNISEWSDQSPAINCEFQPCALSGNVPRPYGKFYAMSGFYVVYRFFNLTTDAVLDDVIQKGEEFCKKNWNDAKNSVSAQPYIEQYCFRAPYIVYLLRDGLHITDSDMSIGSGSMTWALGVALWEADREVSNKRRSYYEIFRVNINPVIVFGFVLISLFVLVCTSSCVRNSLNKYLRRQYLPLFRNKLALSPTTANTPQNPFESTEKVKKGLFRSSSSVGNLQLETSSIVGSFWTPHGSQRHLQSRRSVSREDLISAQADSSSLV